MITAKIIQKQQAVFGIITEMGAIILLLISESFEYKSSIAGKTTENQENNENTEERNAKTKRNLEIIVPLKYLSNFWKTLDIPLINCEVSLTVF